MNVVRVHSGLAQNMEGVGSKSGVINSLYNKPEMKLKLIRESV